MSKVSILTHSFLDAYNRSFNRIFLGGLERYIYDLSILIKEMGHEVEVHQLSYFDEFQAVFQDILVRGYTYDLNKVAEAMEHMASKADGLIIYSSGIWHPIKYKTKSIAICHGINWDKNNFLQEEKHYVSFAIQGALNQLEKIISVDSHFLTYCRSVCSYKNPEQVVLIPNAIDTNYFVPSTKESESEYIHILFPRRISYERGIIIMMLASDKLLEDYDKIIIEFAGDIVKDSPMGEIFINWLNEHPNKQRIIHKTYSFDNMVEAYQKADIVVIPTIFSEGTSFSCLEAISCGVPVVSSNVGGLNDIIIDGFNGLLVTPTNERIIEAVSKLIEDSGLRDKIGKNGRNTALAFDKVIWKKKWRNILQAHLE